MSKIMPIITELWNNTISPYKNWHNKIKWFGIFIKPNKCQKKIENRNKRKEGLTWGSSPAQPSSSRPAQPGGGPAHLAPPLSSSSPTGERRVPTRAHRRASTSCFPGHLLLPPCRLERPGRRHAVPTALSLSPSSSPTALSPTREPPPAGVETAVDVVLTGDQHHHPPLRKDTVSTLVTSNPLTSPWIAAGDHRSPRAPTSLVPPI